MFVFSLVYLQYGADLYIHSAIKRHISALILILKGDSQQHCYWYVTSLKKLCRLAWCVCWELPVFHEVYCFSTF